MGKPKSYHSICNESENTLKLYLVIRNARADTSDVFLLGHATLRCVGTASWILICTGCESPKPVNGPMSRVDSIETSSGQKRQNDTTPAQPAVPAAGTVQPQGTSAGKRSCG
jgi:hypothetical protein